MCVCSNTGVKRGYILFVFIIITKHLFMMYTLASIASSCFMDL